MFQLSLGDGFSINRLDESYMRYFNVTARPPVVRKGWNKSFVEDDAYIRRLVKDAKVIFAFPGLGKTSLAKQRSGFVDLDVGKLREGGKPWEEELTNETVRLIVQEKILEETGKGNVVLCNDFSCYGFADRQGFKPLVVVPMDLKKVVTRVLKRGQTAFASAMSLQGKSWISDWKAVSSIVVKAEYLIDLVALFVDVEGKKIVDWTLEDYSDVAKQRYYEVKRRETLFHRATTVADVMKRLLKDARTSYVIDVGAGPSMLRHFVFDYKPIDEVNWIGIPMETFGHYRDKKEERRHVLLFQFSFFKYFKKAYMKKIKNLLRNEAVVGIVIFDERHLLLGAGFKPGQLYDSSAGTFAMVK
jgi:hypothetical protein